MGEHPENLIIRDPIRAQTPWALTCDCTMNLAFCTFDYSPFFLPLLRMIFRQKGLCYNVKTIL